jgi:hypothetical protein
MLMQRANPRQFFDLVTRNCVIYELLSHRYFTFLLLYVHSIRKYCDHEKIYLENLSYLHFFSHPEYGNVILGMPPVWKYMYCHVLVTSHRV